MIEAIRILNSSALLTAHFDEIARQVEEVFHIPVTFHKFPVEIEKAYDASRRQYFSTAFLTDKLITGLSAQEKYIVIVDVDLFIPILTYVYGEAQFEGHAAIVSTYRLLNGFYGLPDNGELFLQRLNKEIIHELGHTFGLYHCRQFECVMRSSTYIEEVDLKRLTLCNDCGEILNHKI